MKSSKIGKRDGGLINMTTQTEQIRGKVARILNSREVALNIGTEHGVQSGMTFDILAPGSGEVTDPDTGEVLGSVDLPKTRVRITRAHDRFAIATTYRSKRVNVGGAGYTGVGSAADNLRKMFEPPRWETRYETLKSNGGFEATAEDLDEKDSYVSVGDPVVQIMENVRPVKARDLIPEFSERIEWSTRSLDQVPMSSACYLLTSDDDSVLYIGRSSNLRDRIRHHLHNSRMEEETPLGTVHWLYYHEVPVDKLAETEHELFSAYISFSRAGFPPLNRRGVVFDASA